MEESLRKAERMWWEISNHLSMAELVSLLGNDAGIPRRNAYYAQRAINRRLQALSYNTRDVLLLQSGNQNAYNIREAIARHPNDIGISRLGSDALVQCGGMV